MGIGSDRAEEMLDEHRDNFVRAARQVPRAHARAIGQSGNGWARSFWVYLSSILMENDIYIKQASQIGEWNKAWSRADSESP